MGGQGITTHSPFPQRPDWRANASTRRPPCAPSIEAAFDGAADVTREETGPLERVLAAADSGNGLSAELDIARWQFINPELTVHLHRMAVGEWICLDAGTTISAGGAGLATSVLSDLDGPVGVGAQSLLVAARSG